MKKLKQILAVVALVFCCSMVVKADTKAAQITGVKQVDDSSSSINISCDPMLEKGIQYVVELSTDNKNWVFMKASTSPDSIYIGNLGAGQTYYARVTGASQVNSSTGTYTPSTTASEPIEVVTAPKANISVVQSNATTNSVSVNVTQATGANYYKLVYNKAVIGQGTSSTVTSSSNLNPGANYWVYVYTCRRSDATGYIAEGSYSYLYVKTLQPKISKNNFGIANAWLNIDSYNFAVNTGYATSGYQFQLQNTAGKVKKTIETTTTTKSISNLKGTFYKYRVRAYVACGSKRVYNEWSDFKTFAFAKKVTRKYGKSNKLNINWSKISGASGYVIFISDKENSGYKKVKSLGAKKRSITISKMGKKKLKKNTTYYVRIMPKSKKLGKADSYGYYTFRL